MFLNLGSRSLSNCKQVVKKRPGNFSGYTDNLYQSLAFFLKEINLGKKKTLKARRIVPIHETKITPSFGSAAMVKKAV